jgi:PQ loop repeat
VDYGLPVIAGAISTVIFAASTVPMLVKAWRTKDVASYSLGNLALANAGNVIHAVYVFHLPAGPVWVLHAFYLVTTAFMLVWYLRFRSGSVSAPRQGAARSRQMRECDGRGGRDVEGIDARRHRDANAAV